jgi:hypothetical protein
MVAVCSMDGKMKLGGQYITRIWQEDILKVGSESSIFFLWEKNNMSLRLPNFFSGFIVF